MKEVKMDGKRASVVFFTLIRIRFTLQSRSGGEGVMAVGVCAWWGSSEECDTALLYGISGYTVE